MIFLLIFSKGYYETHFGMKFGPPVSIAGYYGRISGRKIGKLEADIMKATGLILISSGSLVLIWEHLF